VTGYGGGGDIVGKPAILRHPDLPMCNAGLLVPAAAWLALPAGQVALHRDAITHSQIVDATAYFFHHTGPFVAGHHRISREALRHGSADDL